MAAAVLATANAKAQDAEPRFVQQHPCRSEFSDWRLYLRRRQVGVLPELAIADADFESLTGAGAYVRAFDAWGKSAKVDVIVPYTGFSARALVAGEPHKREMTGFGDPRFRVSVNVFGAPAMSVKEFAHYKQDLIVGLSLQVSAPLGQYDDTKLLNFGTTAGPSGRTRNFQGLGAMDSRDRAERDPVYR